MQEKNRVEIAGIPFDPVTYEQALVRVRNFVGNSHKVYVTTPNPEMILASLDEDNHEFRKVLKNANLSIPDGIGILWASYYLSTKLPKSKIGQWFQVFTSLSSILLAPKKIRKHLPERVTGSDLFEKIVDKSQKKGWGIYLLGAAPGVGQKAITALKTKYPEANFVGHYSGSPDHEEEDAICERIKKAKADILFVAYGAPAQELWIHRNLFKFETIKVAIGIGGAFDFVAGEVKRAPKIMRAIGLEWLWRWIQQPRRTKRIKNATWQFVKAMLEEKRMMKDSK